MSARVLWAPFARISRDGLPHVDRLMRSDPIVLSALSIGDQLRLRKQPASLCSEQHL